MRKLISVKKRHIQKGERGNPYGCPVFLALRDANIPVDHIIGSTIMIDKVVYPLPKSVHRWIRRLDNYKRVKPFRFWLKVIKRWQVKQQGVYH